MLAEFRFAIGRVSGIDLDHGLAGAFVRIVIVLTVDQRFVFAELVLTFRCSSLLLLLFSHCSITMSGKYTNECKRKSKKNDEV